MVIQVQAQLWNICGGNYDVRERKENDTEDLLLFVCLHSFRIQV